MKKNKIKELALGTLKISRNWYRGFDENGKTRKPIELILLRQNLIDVLFRVSGYDDENEFVWSFDLSKNDIYEIEKASEAIIKWGSERGLPITQQSKEANCEKIQN